MTVAKYLGLLAAVALIGGSAVHRRRAVDRACSLSNQRMAPR